MKKLAAGAGIKYYRWNRGEAENGFLVGASVDMSSDLIQHWHDGKDHEARYGKDLGNGWVLNHPLKKLVLYQWYLNEAGGDDEAAVDEAAAAEEAEAPSGVPAAAESPAEPAAAETAAAPAAAAEAAADAPAAEAADEAPAPDGKVVALEERLERMTAKIAREIASVDERLGDRLHLIDRDNDGIVDVEEIRDALAAIALRQNKFREDPEALEAFIQVALREIDANSDDVITVEEVEKWFDSLEEEVEDQ